MNKLVPSVVRLISSGQVIHSIQSVIKELIENSLDAGATSIDIKLENFGLDKIEIRDNGCGIPATETAYMGQKHYTSKLRDMQDLSSIMTYGFRGEALSSLCAVSDVSIVTKTQTDNVSTFYELHYDGTIKKSKPSHYGQGTSIIACNLFKSLPVRRQVYKTNKKCKEELKRIEDLIISYAIIKPTVRFCLKHNKSVIWQKCQVADIGSAISVAFGRAVFSEMITINYKGEDPAFSLRGYIPKNYSNDELTGRSNSDRCFIYINQRPVMFKGVLQAIKHHYLACQKGQINKWPIAILDFTIDSKLVDVNVESSKTQVYLSFKVYQFQFPLFIELYNTIDYLMLTLKLKSSRISILFFV
ncbi:uncharacterized protein TRIADDRAFT_30981 [Trichoplax adhaerens]|uniref:DNA mismatch repair protein S5 domain-containing protein n=1 Tax=Trichoplax adhaerens TaxID=10228 RepID=B3S868_TRIAD|nr:hypothetical protein TRIADDRAFT_30981 [Trichoplax adhaerens]EDV21050.1 hypothetical protein TRIADDRAFT_30981 [Trichoplax adhaerens]|eukprot:XP_002116380.1 hypothetical protein TRIADDRAFT_30981 [Trichoplax adhaerens]